MVVINNQVLFFQYLVLTALGEGCLSGQSVGTAAHSNYYANTTGNIFDLQCLCYPKNLPELSKV